MSPSLADLHPLRGAAAAHRYLDFSSIAARAVRKALKPEAAALVRACVFVCGVRVLACST
jgi:hypothetical protein